MMQCSFCPRNCKVNRTEQAGFCRVKGLTIARVGIHEWEEPCISGTHGSGTIFFSGCNLRCIFCQNDTISRSAYGREISVDTLGKLMLYQQSVGAENINLVSPTQFTGQIAEALAKYKPQIKIPVVYNSNGYESVDRTKDAYLKLAENVVLGLHKMPKSRVLENELLNLQNLPNKVDHPRTILVNGVAVKGGKDIAE